MQLVGTQHKQKTPPPVHSEAAYKQYRSSLALLEKLSGQHFQGVNHLDAAAVLLKAVGKLHHATGAAGRDRFGAGPDDRGTLGGIDLHRCIVVVDVERAAETAAEIRTLHFRQLHSRCGAEQLAGLADDPPCL